VPKFRSFHLFLSFRKKVKIKVVNKKRQKNMTLLPPRTTAVRRTETQELDEATLYRILNSLKEKQESDYKLFLEDGAKKEQIPIPKEALSLLVEILTHMKKGNGVKIVPIRKEITTTEAADILNVSRPYFVGLLESGQIPFRSVGSRRRILSEDVMNYKNQIDAKREQTLAELAAQAQELNMGY